MLLHGDLDHREREVFVERELFLAHRKTFTVESPIKQIIVDKLYKVAEDYYILYYVLYVTVDKL